MPVVRQRRTCILYATFLLLNFSCQTWHDVRQDEELQNSDLTVLRGNRTSPDRIQLCPSKPWEGSNSRHIESDSLICTEAKEKCDDNGYICACKRSRPTFIVSKRQCVNNLSLRGGCSFRFGSWRYATGWAWTKLNDPLLSLFLDDGYGIAGGFNASNKQFESCKLTNITALIENGEWGRVDFDAKDITFFVSKAYYHISWNTENMVKEKRQKIRGRILKCSISCQPRPERLTDIIRYPTESCLLFKVTGSFTPARTVFPLIPPRNESKKDSTTAIIIALCVTSILLLAGIVIGVVCHRRRSGANITPRFVSDFMARI